MSSPDHRLPRARLHPLIVACLAAIAARGIGVLLHFTSRDPNGNRISAAPFESLLLALPYHGAVLITSAAVLLAVWKLLPRLRAGVTATGVVLAAAAIVLGQVDLAMQWFIGQRFSPTAADTYLGANVVSTEVLSPLFFHPAYLTVGLLLMVVPLVVVGWSVLSERRGAPLRAPQWWMVAALFGVAALCRIPLALAHSHQRDVTRPPELLFLYHAINPREVPAPADAAGAIAELRALVDPTGTARWLDPELPLVRAAGPTSGRGSEGDRRVLPDVFVFSIESLRGADVGYVPGNYRPGESPTPALDRLAAGGVVYSRYIATGNPSPRGFFGIQTGVIDHREAFIVCCSTSTEFDALPQRMRRLGYFTLNVWGANPSFDNVLFWSNKWYDRIRSPGPSGPLALTRALPDDRTVDMVIEEIAAYDRERPDQPLFAFIATAGTHEPYTIERGSRLPEETVRAIAAERDPRRRYRMMLRQLDVEIERVLEFLDARPTKRPRVVIVVGDHADAAGDSIPPEFRGLPYDAVEWTAALIAGPSELIGPPRVDTFHASHADLMPTVLDLVGDTGPTIAMGTSLLAAVPPEQRTAISVSGFGYRMDRGGWSLLVRRASPEVFYTHRAFTPLTTARPSLEGSPFTPADVMRLWEGMNTWSWLIEQNRVWRPHVLDGEGTLAAGRR
jgi:hypothetical protein